MKFDLIIANPPYGDSSVTAAQILKCLIDSGLASQIVYLCPPNAYKPVVQKKKLNLWKYVTKIQRGVRADFGDASIYNNAITTIISGKSNYTSYPELCLSEKDYTLLKAVLDYNKSHSNGFYIEDDFRACQQNWSIDFAFSFAISNNGSTDAKHWTEKVSLKNFNKKREGPTADIKFNFGLDDYLDYCERLGWDVSYPRLMNCGNIEKRNNFSKWYYEVTNGLVNKLRFIISECEGITPRPTFYIDYFPQVDWSRPWTDEEILKEIGLPEDFLEKE